MQYIVRNRRRLRPATGELVPAMQQRPITPMAKPATAVTLTPAQLSDADTVVADIEPMPRVEGSGVHRRPLVIEINLTVPVRGRSD